MSIKKAIVITGSTAVVTSIAFAQGPNTLEGAQQGAILGAIGGAALAATTEIASDKKGSKK